MKKTLLLISLFLICNTFKSSAQITYLNEPFSGTTIPVDWTQTTMATDGGWLFGTNIDLQSSSFPIPPHNNFACTNDDACDCDKSADVLVSDTIDLSTSVATILQFEYYFTDDGEVASVELSNDNGATWNVVDTLTTSGPDWDTRSYDITAWASGHSQVLIAFRYNDLGGYQYGFAIDDVNIYQPANDDAILSIVSPDAGSGLSFAAVGDSVSIGGSIYNNGVNTITSCIITWTDGINTYPYTFNTNIPTTGTADFVHSQKYPIQAIGEYPITVWVELLNDAEHTNDTLQTILTGVTFVPSHKVTIEDQTICSSGYGIYCPRGIVFMDSMERSPYRSMTELISVHSSGFSAPFDPMVNSVYEAGSGNILTAWPEIHTDRVSIAQPDSIFAEYENHINDFGVADLDVTLAYDNTSRALDISVDAHFAIEVTPSLATYNLALVLTEDSVHSTDPTYAQRNTYSGGGEGPMASSTMDFVAQPDPVPASQMYYMHVAREILGTWLGTNGSLPTTIAENSVQSYTFPTYTVPGSYNTQNMRAIVLLVNAGTGEIKNANGASLNIPVGVDELSKVSNALSIYPNPFTDETTVSFNLVKSEPVSLCISNLIGETISVMDKGMMNAGEHSIQLSGKNLPAGMYFVTLKRGNNSSTKKVTLYR